MLLPKKPDILSMLLISPKSRFHKQLEVVANTDIFLGIHGNGLTHLVFLPNDAMVIEYYQGGESAFFRYLAQMRGVQYHGNSGSRWVTNDNTSLENEQPFQADVTLLDIEGTLELIRTKLH